MNVFPGSSPLVTGFPWVENLCIGRIKQDCGRLSGQGNLTCVLDNATLQLSEFMRLACGP
jgi:hypothetical protein